MANILLPLYAVFLCFFSIICDSIKTNDLCTCLKSTESSNFFSIVTEQIGLTRLTTWEMPKHTTIETLFLIFFTGIWPIGSVWIGFEWKLSRLICVSIFFLEKMNFIKTRLILFSYMLFYVLLIFHTLWTCFLVVEMTFW